MKAYNKKGLITGTIFCVIGAFSLIKNLTVPSDLMILQIRNIVISFLALSIGLNSLIRALSKKCTEEDILKNKCKKQYCQIEKSMFSVCHSSSTYLHLRNIVYDCILFY